MNSEMADLGDRDLFVITADQFFNRKIRMNHGSAVPMFVRPKIRGGRQPVNWSLSALTGAERTLRLAGLPLIVMGSFVNGFTP